MSDSLINKVAESGLISIDLASFLPNDTVVVFDIKPYLFMELILKEKEVIAEIKSDGAEVIMSTPKEFSDRIRDDMIKWSVIIKSAGISQQ